MCTWYWWLVDAWYFFVKSLNEKSEEMHINECSRDERQRYEIFTHLLVPGPSLQGLHLHPMSLPHQTTQHLLLLPCCEIHHFQDLKRRSITWSREHANCNEEKVGSVKNTRRLDNKGSQNYKRVKLYIYTETDKVHQGLRQSKEEIQDSITIKDLI